MHSGRLGRERGRGWAGDSCPARRLNCRGMHSPLPPRPQPQSPRPSLRDNSPPELSRGRENQPIRNSHWPFASGGVPAAAAPPLAAVAKGPIPFPLKASNATTSCQGRRGSSACDRREARHAEGPFRRSEAESRGGCPSPSVRFPPPPPPLQGHALVGAGGASADHGRRVRPRSARPAGRRSQGGGAGRIQWRGSLHRARGGGKRGRTPPRRPGSFGRGRGTKTGSIREAMGQQSARLRCGGATLALERHARPSRCASAEAAMAASLPRKPPASGNVRAKRGAGEGAATGASRSRKNCPARVGNRARSSGLTGEVSAQFFFAILQM